MIQIMMIYEYIYNSLQFYGFLSMIKWFHLDVYKTKQYLLSASTSSISSSRIFLLKGCPIILRMSATKSQGILPERLWSKPSNALRRTATNHDSSLNYLITKLGRSVIELYNAIPSTLSVLMAQLRLMLNKCLKSIFLNAWL